jgi:hypothetical protein
MNDHESFQKNATNSDKIIDVESFDSDSDIIEINALDGQQTNNIQSSYHENDQIENIDEVSKRWNVKKLANINKNFSCSNYKRRYFSDTRPIEPKQFKPGIFVFDDTEKRLCEQTEKLRPSQQEQSLVDMEKIKIDSLALVSRIEGIKDELNKMKEILHKVHCESIENLRKLAGPDAATVGDLFFQDTINKLKESYLTKLRELEKSAEFEEHALESIFNSRNYELGKLSEYRKFETFQPCSQRSKYQDSGHRLILLPLNKIKNILIEDEIYNYYYPLPIRSKHKKEF